MIIIIVIIGIIINVPQEMKARGVGVDQAVDDYDEVKAKLGPDADTSGSRFNDAFRIARAENTRRACVSPRRVFLWRLIGLEIVCISVPAVRLRNYD